MNAAFLLVTSAWLAGGQAPPTPPTTPPAAPPPAQVAPAPAPGYGCGCNGGCGSTCGCESDHAGFRDRLRARFHREDCGCAPAPACNECERSSLFGRLHSRHEGGGCGSTCECESQGLLGRFRGRFHRGNDCGCDSGCGGAYGTGYGPAPAALPPVKPGEPIKPPSDSGPMKLPSGEQPKDKDKDKDKETSAAPRTPDLTPASGARIVESGTKNPF